MSDGEWGDVIRGVGREVGGAVKDGGTMALANKANKLLLQGVRKALEGQIDDELLNHPMVDHVGGLAVPILFLGFCEAFPDLIPKVDLVREACKQALRAGTYNAGVPLLEQLTPFFSQLAGIGEALEKQTQQIGKEEDPVVVAEEIRATRKKARA